MTKLDATLNAMDVASIIVGLSCKNLDIGSSNYGCNHLTFLNIFVGSH
jgi:hypothetical protein